MVNATESFSRSLDVVKPEENFSAELKSLAAETKNNPDIWDEKPMYLSSKVVADRAIYIAKQWKKSFEEMYGKSQPQEFNGQKVWRYTKMDISRINDNLKAKNNPNKNKESLKVSYDLDGLRNKSEQISQDVQKFLDQAKSKLGKYDTLDDTFSAPIYEKFVSVKQLPKITTTYEVDGYRNSQSSPVNWLEITIDDKKAWTKVTCDIYVWREKTWQFTTDDYFRYSVMVDDVVTIPEETHNLDDDSYAEKHKSREYLNKILWLAERVLPRCPNIIDNEVKKYSAQIKTDKIIKQGEEGKKIQENKAAEDRLKNVIGW